MRSAAEHVVAIAPFAHSSRRLKQRLRAVVGDNCFTARASPAGAFEMLVDECKAHMRRKGARLRDMYIARQLDSQLGRYKAPMLSSHNFVRMLATINNTPSTHSAAAAAAAVAALACDGGGGGDSGSATVQSVGHSWRQPVVAAAIPLFQATLPDNAARRPVIGGHEGPFIHLLRLLALAINTTFQKTVKEELDKAGVPLVGDQVFSQSIKGYERMWNKLQVGGRPPLQSVAATTV